MVKKTSFKIVWDLEAINHFKEILTFLEEQSENAPKIVKGAIIERIKQVKNNPQICESDKLKEPSDNEFRAFVIFSYRITYQIKLAKNEIRIIRIRRTSREPFGY